MDEVEVKRSVRENYGAIARSGGSCCGTSDCGCGSQASLVTLGKEIGYAEEDLTVVPEGANLGLGCGNPVALASLKAGETVLDLGAGGGFDCFLAARQVGEQGKVIGVDMTPEMIEKARVNARKGGYANVEFRLGEIEHLPVADNTVDAIISNCVINLAPNKRRVFDEAFRVLKPGGRLMVSDIVLLRQLPEEFRQSVRAYVSCVSGAELKSLYLQTIREAGFTDVAVVDEARFSVDFLTSYVDATPELLADITATVVSAKIRAVKPAAEVLVRPVRPADAEAFTEIRLLPSVLETMCSTPSERVADRRRSLESLGPNDHVLVAESDGKVVGVASLQVLGGRRRHVGDLSIAVHEEYQGRGIGRRLMHALLDIADNYLGLARTELEVVGDNTRAIRLYESLGFEVEGAKRGGYFRQGRLIDLVIMGRLRPA